MLPAASRRLTGSGTNSITTARANAVTLATPTAVAAFTKSSHAFECVFLDRSGDLALFHLLFEYGIEIVHWLFGRLNFRFFFGKSRLILILLQLLDLIRGS